MPILDGLKLRRANKSRRVGIAHRNWLVARNRTRCERLWLTRLLEARIGNLDCQRRKRCDAFGGRCPSPT